MGILLPEIRSALTFPYSSCSVQLKTSVTACKANTRRLRKVERRRKTSRDLRIQATTSRGFLQFSFASHALAWLLQGPTLDKAVGRDRKSLCSLAKRGSLTRQKMHVQ